MPKRPDDSADGKARYQVHVFPDERFIDLNLYQFGREKCLPLHQYGPAMRNHFLFHYIVSGKGRLDAGGQTFFLQRGQGFILYPGQIATYYADEKDPWEYVWLEFDGLRAKESVTLAGMKEDCPVYTPASREAGERIRRLMMYLIDHPTDPPMRLVGYGMQLLAELVQSGGRQGNVGNRRLSNFYIREAIDYINACYQNDISIEEIAAACGLNRNYFGRVFKEIMGESPQQFLLHYRMAKAAELLRNSRMSVKDISVSVGYENPLHFSRAFKGVFGSSPSQYRQNHFHM